MVKCTEHLLEIIGGDIYDEVTKPKHYNQGKVETIDKIDCVLRDLSFDLEPLEIYCLGNVIKYHDRCEHKGNKQQDLEKAHWYFMRFINSIVKRMKEEEENGNDKY